MAQLFVCVLLCSASVMAGLSQKRKCIVSGPTDLRRFGAVKTCFEKVVGKMILSGMATLIRIDWNDEPVFLVQTIMFNEMCKVDYIR